jgi:hypothetical protein
MEKANIMTRTEYMQEKPIRDRQLRLIELGPEMAEALKRLVGDVDLGEVDYEAPERDSLEYARAVLAKLEGEA